ncbi:tyrosine-protein kinase Etk/Wzc [Paraburkholderia sp. BL6669N2]|uniref:polysaccharide biosynthesis tyrosine autokinase n=1 Tax=Paraburkholderia sp. BL6669N2 TaxID=1938807 RepID=UPI000E268DB5|nr:polysaccharide biosynthesis tyrosine autokinase [Paraburkholderia sp. BL6669N2]REG45617.1 tyrosine-protein kinase Etk/Wzc [Paraburkholderia sp. BL6669N2]
MNTPSLKSQRDQEVVEEYSYPLLDVLLDHKRVVASVFVLFLLIGVAYAFLARPQYEADILVQVEDSPQNTVSKGVLGDVSSLFDVQSTGQDETQIIQSRRVVTAAVDKVKLYIDAQPRYFPLIGFWTAKYRSDRALGLSNPGVFGVGGFAWGDERIDVDVFDVPQVDEDDKFKLTILQKGVYQLDGSDLDAPVVGVVGKEEVFQTAVGTIRLKVANVHANPGTRFNLYRHSRLDTIQQLQNQLIVQQTDKQSNVMSVSLTDTNPEKITEIVNEIGQQYVFQNAQRKAAQAAQSLEFLNQQLPELKRNLELSEQRYTDFRNRHGTIDLSQEALLALQQSSQDEAQIVEFEAKRSDLLQRYASNHPSVIGLGKQIETLQQDQKRILAKILTLPNLQQDAVRLQLDVNIDTQLYASLQNSAQELQLVQAGATGNVRVVDHALVPEVPVKPRKALVVAIVAVLGFLCSIAVAILHDLWFGGITSAAEIEQHTGLHVYASVFQSNNETAAEKERRLGTLADCHPNDVAVEALRSLRTALQFALLDAKNNLVLITGPAPSVGKSFVASNLAGLLATGNKKVLLIDADIRNGRLHAIYGKERERGLTEVITGSARFEDALHRDVSKGLDLLTTGILPPNPSEVLDSPRITELLERLKSGYDLIVFDTAPVLAAADAELLSRHVGTVLLVARAGFSKIGEIAEATRRLRQVPAHVAGVVLNGVNASRGRYRYGSKYGGYRYYAYEYIKASQKNRSRLLQFWK